MFLLHNKEDTANKVYPNRSTTVFPMWSKPCHCHSSGVLTQQDFAYLLRHILIITQAKYLIWCIRCYVSDVPCQITVRSYKMDWVLFSDRTWWYWLELQPMSSQGIRVNLLIAHSLIYYKHDLGRTTRASSQPMWGRGDMMVLFDITADTFMFWVILLAGDCIIFKIHHGSASNNSCLRWYPLAVLPGIWQ